MTPQAAQVYKDIFGEEAPWTHGTLEERQRAWQSFLAVSDNAEVPDSDFEQFQERIRQNRSDVPSVRSSAEADAA